MLTTSIFQINHILLFGIVFIICYSLFCYFVILLFLSIHKLAISIRKYNTRTQAQDKKKMQIGGKYIDKGGFGCVITPALKCSLSDKNTDKFVSKIRKTTDSDFYNEIKISNILKKLDPGKKYYLTIDKYCYINNIPPDRKDLLEVNYIDDNHEKFDIVSGQSEKDKHACDIDLSLKPINMLMEYGGYSLNTIMKVSRKMQGTKAKMHQMFVDNLRPYLKHLILGIIKMHFHRIVNLDIKPRNIIMNWNKDTNNVQLRYIDFGLSDFLTEEFCSSYDNIKSKGTPTFISPELIISYIVSRYTSRSDNYKLKIIFQELDTFRKNIIHIRETQLLGNYKQNVFYLYQKIKNLYSNEKLLPVYFGSEKNKFNGYLQKADVYSLGLCIFIMLFVYSDIDISANSQLYDLLLHMITFDPDKRYNAVQCLSHPYFHSPTS